MAATLQSCAGGGGATQAANVTRWYTLCISGQTNAATEANMQLTFRTAGTLSGLYCRITANTVTAASTFTSRKNAGAGNQTVSIGSSATGEFLDTTNSDTVAVTDKINAQLATGATGTNMTITTLGCVFSATGTTVTHLGCNNTLTLSAASDTEFYTPGTTSKNTTETNKQFKFKAPCTLQNLFVNCLTYTRTDTVTIQTRKNAANGNLLVSVTGTGIFEDTTHSDSFAINDLFCFTSVTGTDGTHTSTFSLICVEQASTAGQSSIICGGAAPTWNANTTYFSTTAGDINWANTTEASAQTRADFIHTASNLECHVNANTVTAASTLTFRKNAANGNQTLSVASSTTGYFEDTTHTDSIQIADELGYQMAVGATGTSMKVDVIGYLASVVGFVQSSGLDFIFPKNEVVNY